MSDGHIVGRVEVATLSQSDVVRIVSLGERGEKRVALTVVEILPPVVFCWVNEQEEIEPGGRVKKSSESLARFAVDGCLEPLDGAVTVDMASQSLYDHRAGFKAIPDDAWKPTPIPCERIELFQ